MNTTATAPCSTALTAFRQLLYPRGDQDPFPLYKTLRDVAPVLSNPPFLRNGIVLSRYQDCSAALRNRVLVPIPGGGINPISSGEPSGVQLASRWLVYQHGTRHTGMRNTIATHFARDRINDLRGFIEDAAERRIEGLASGADAHQVVDLVETLLLPFPVSIISHIIGIEDSAAQSLGWAGRALSGVLEPLKTPSLTRRINNGAVQLVQFFTEAASQRRAEPRNDLLSSLAQQSASDSASDGQELISNLSFVFCAGYDSSTSFLGTAVRTLLDHPDQAAALRDGKVAPRTAVAELLRYDPPVHMTARVANEPVCIGGEDVPAGTLVWILLGSANRDPELLDRPDQLDITRTPVPNLAFSAGPHFCLGTHLAMMEAEVLLPRLLCRFPGMRLAQSPRYRSPGTAVRGIDHLPVILGQAATRNHHRNGAR
ncbi:MAG: cytochrome P450 [Pseudonocardiaceae bacterium]